MSKALWDYYDGEPFLQNPHLGIVSMANPKRKKGRKKMAIRRRRRGSKRTARRRVRTTSVRRRRTGRRRMRRNAYYSAGAIANPRRRRRTSRRRRNPVARRRRSSYRRNPALFGFQLPPIKAVLFAGVGFVATPFVEGMVTPFLPAMLTSSNVGKLATRIGIVVGITYAAKKIAGPDQAKMIAIGGGLYVATQAIKDFAPGFASSIGLRAYVPPAGMSGMKAYVAPQNLGMPNAFKYSFGTGSGAIGGTAARFLKR